jgi:hypothetical protein
MSPRMPDEALKRMRVALAAGRRLEAVQLYREHSGKDLGEAMAFISALEGELRQSAPEEFRDPPEAVRRTRFGGCAFIVFGAVFAIWGVNEIVPSLTSSSGIAEGTVVKEEHNEGPVAVFEYQVDGKKYTRKQHHAIARHRVGETVRVVYKTDDPDVASIDSFYDRWLVPIVLAATAVLSAGFGALLVWQPPWMRVR